MMSEIRVLIVDDEASVRNVLGQLLTSEGYLVSFAKSANETTKAVADFHPHLIILDLGLVDQDGLFVLKSLRAWTTVPVIILTVADDEVRKVQLLDAGADDYLTKPFGSSELLARCRLALRHRGVVEATPIFESDDLMIDINARKVFINGNEVRLSKTEFEIIQRLARENGKVISQKTLTRQIWGAAAANETHYLRIYINQLRKKIEVNPSEPRHIITEPGVGYRLV